MARRAREKLSRSRVCVVVDMPPSPEVVPIGHRDRAEGARRDAGAAAPVAVPVPVPVPVPVVMKMQVR